MGQRKFTVRIGSIVLLIALAFLINILSQEKTEVPSEPVRKSTERIANMDKADRAATEPLNMDAVAKPEVPYVSPVDFEYLQSQNPDIYAWLEVQGTEISYPLLQHPSDNSYYLKRGTDGRYHAAGSLFTEHQYNHTDFTDPVTIVYGHNMADGTMFGHLQQLFSDLNFFSENGEMVVYMPDQELHFRVFAAVPFENWHILYYYAFSDRQSFQAFFHDIRSIRAIGANHNKAVRVEPGDQVLILSTCLKGNRNKRYLVCAKRLDNQ